MPDRTQPSSISLTEVEWRTLCGFAEAEPFVTVRIARTGTTAIMSIVAEADARRRAVVFAHAKFEDGTFRWAQLSLQRLPEDCWHLLAPETRLRLAAMRGGIG